MIFADRTKGRLWNVLASLCLSFAAGAAVGTQSPADSDGWQIPPGAASERNPQPVDGSVLAKGRSLYKGKCQRCHGADGAGHGPEADRNHPAGDLRDASRASRNPDGVMFYKIWNGRANPKMPAMKADLTRDDVWVVIDYVNTLRR